MPERRPRWRFGRMRPMDINQDPVQGEFFSRESDLPGRLVREAIQNSLDARLGTEPVRVRFVFSGDGGALPVGRAARYLDGLKEHVAAVADADAAALGVSVAEDADETDAVQAAVGCFAKPMTYLVVEDFGTKGLTGDTRANSESEQGNDFWGFFRSVGISTKGEDDAGSWGLGKWVFPDASAINAYLGMTQRSGEDVWLLMGMAFLRTHSCGEAKYQYNGTFAQHDDADDNSWLPVPLDSGQDQEFILNALEDFNLERLDDSGLSVVVLYPKVELEPAAIARAVLTQYFLPVLRGDLVVEIVHPEAGSRTIDSTGILDEAARVKPAESDHQSERPDESSESLRGLIEFAQWATELPADEHIPLEAPSRGRWDKLGPSLDAIRERYEQEGKLALRLATRVRSRTKGAARPSDFRVYLERADDLDQGHDYFVRGHLRIPHMDHIRRFKARALVLVDGTSELGHLLRDAEGPAHDRWDNGSTRLRERWQGGPERVNEVRRAPLRLLQQLVERPNEKQTDALFDLFPGGAAQIRRGGRGPGGTGAGTGPVVVPQPLLQIASPPGAFVVRPTPTNEESGLVGKAWDLCFAYDTMRGNPFKAFEAGVRQGSPDFSLLEDTLAVSAEGCEWTPAGANTLRFTATEDAFRLRVSGFDDRDVKVELREIGEELEESIAVVQAESGTA